MTGKELKDLLASVPDDRQVVFRTPMHEMENPHYYSPETGRPRTERLEGDVRDILDDPNELHTVIVLKHYLD